VDPGILMSIFCIVLLLGTGSKLGMFWIARRGTALGWKVCWKRTKRRRCSVPNIAMQCLTLVLVTIQKIYYRSLFWRWSRFDLHE
jgi:hypothetical protein